MTEAGKVTRPPGTPPAPAAVAVPAGPALRAGETSTSDPELEACRRTSMRHYLTGALACGAIALGLGAFCLRYLLTHDLPRFMAASHPAVLPQLASYGLGTSLLVGIGACIAAREWMQLRAPPQPNGPDPPPRPMTARRRALRAVGFWLLIQPFTGMGLVFAYAAVDHAVRESWKDAGIFLVLAVFFGSLGVLLIAGSGIAGEPGVALEPGAPVPAVVRTSRWWRRVLWVLFFWCLFTTFGAVSSGLQGQGGDSAGYAATALASWTGLFLGLRGNVPDNPFSS